MLVLVNAPLAHQRKLAEDANLLAKITLVNAPLVFQRKLAEDADRNTTHHAKTDEPAAVFFLRQPSKPNAARPVAKNGKVAGSGTGETPFQLAVAKSSTTHDWPNGTVRVMVLKGTLETNP